MQGKALGDPLEDHRSVRAARGRYRILYRVEDIVRVDFLGPRRPGHETDVYAVAEKLVRGLAPRRTR